jgi:Fe-S-cluster containining protein
VERSKLFNSSLIKKYLKKKNPGKQRSYVVKSLCDPDFPLYFVLRNLGWLKSEKWWNDLSPRARRAHTIRILLERIAIFNEVKGWRKKGNGLAPTPAAEIQSAKAPGYCNKCGLCCEVASGMADFPRPGKLPERWRQIFSNGLGQGHRFCPFLWEDNGTGGSMCSIYPYRSNPCRLFGFEECDFFWTSPEPDDVSNETKLFLAGRWLAGLIDSRKLPLAAADIAAKRPKFLKLDRI